MNQPDFISAQQMPNKYVYLTMAAYAPGLLAPLLPAEQLVLAGSSHTMALWYQFSGQAVLVVLALMLLVQILVWQRKKHWMIWPGILAGLHATAFSGLRIASLLSQQKDTAGSLANTLQSSATPMIGLYLLLISGLALIGMHGWLYGRKMMNIHHSL